MSSSDEPQPESASVATAIASPANAPRTVVKTAFDMLTRNPLRRRGYITVGRKKEGPQGPSSDAWKTCRPTSVGLPAQERGNLQVIVISRRLGALGDVEIDRGLRRSGPRRGLGGHGHDILRHCARCHG